ncbi:GPI-anchored small secreted protein [Crepidotus variabilis]|uniref:GPI-anchored small secreted protein n=1 Tax=Crepidotus variabilis TaxID=179855 RepID=A0A9P6JLJ4_9AGAR|nr:GPI-anchored small secreted protein [Crepidotus variabilis]
MKFFASVLAATLITSVAAVVRPGADTPLFYLVSSSTTSAANLLSVKMDGSLLGSLTSGTPAKFEFRSGQLVAADPAGSSTNYRPLINAVLGSTGCSTYGQLGFTQGSSTNKCAQYSTFSIQSDSENSQLGAKLAFNSIGGFYACGSTLNVVYKVNPADGPSDCNPVDLWTVPASS